MKKDYRKDLENAARQMILVHRVDTLISLVLRAIMRNIKVNHAGVFLYDKVKDEYVVKVSTGKTGLKVPAGFAKVDKNNVVVQYFTRPDCARFNQDFLFYNRLSGYISSLKANHKRKNKDLINFLKELREEMSLYQAKICIPGFYRKNLLGILFLGRKADSTDFDSEEIGFLSVLASDVVMAIQNTRLFEDLNKQLETNKRLFLSTVSALSAAIEAKDKYTVGHTERVVQFSMAIADELKNVKVDNWEKFKENLSIAALLHDIGKIAVPEKILNKKSPLNDHERALINTHPVAGIEILTPINEFQDVMLGVKYHHERYDGAGYPFKLKGDEIPLIASVISVADSYDAMTTNRAYRKALSKQEAIEEIKRNRAKQFNPIVVDAFLAAFTPH